MIYINGQQIVLQIQTLFTLIIKFISKLNENMTHHFFCVQAVPVHVMNTSLGDYQRCIIEILY